MLRITKSFDDDYDDLMLNEDEDCISLLMLSIDVIICQSSDFWYLPLYLFGFNHVFHFNHGYQIS